MGGENGARAGNGARRESGAVMWQASALKIVMASANVKQLISAALMAKMFSGSSGAGIGGGMAALRNIARHQIISGNGVT